MKILSYRVKTEDQIREVERHPAVWNTSVDDYGNKVKRKDNWHAIVMKLIPDFSGKTSAEKNEMLTATRKKWRGLRTCFTRELLRRKKEKNSPEAYGRRPYVYFEALRFLDAVSKQNTNQTAKGVDVNSKVDDENEDISLEIQNEDKANEEQNNEEFEWTLNKEADRIPGVHLLENTEDLIQEVEKHPVIWNTTLEGYKHTFERRNAWLDILKRLVPDFEEKSLAEKNEMMAVIQIKWKGVRSCYTRELKRKSEEKNGPGPSGRKQYIYFEDLHFLDTVSRQRTNRKNYEAEAIPRLKNTKVVDMSLKEKEKAAKKQNAKHLTKMKSANRIDDELFQVLKEKILRNEKALREDDEDRLFLLSLTSELHKVHPDRKLKLKADIIAAISDAQQPLQQGPQQMQYASSFPRHSSQFSKQCNHNSQFSEGHYPSSELPLETCLQSNSSMSDNSAVNSDSSTDPSDLDPFK